MEKPKDGFVKIIYLVFLGSLCVTCSVEAQVNNTEQYCDWPVDIRPKPTKWKAKDIPNPQLDVCVCGRYGKKSWVCDPNNIITTAQGMKPIEKINEKKFIDLFICTSLFILGQKSS